MTKPTLTFQPEADRYYAEGHWRSGDLWEDFDRRVDEHPGKAALILDDRAVTFEELRRAAIGVSRRLADGGVQPGEVVILLGRHSIEAALAMLGCLHRGVVLAPLPPMFNTTQLSTLLAQTQAMPGYMNRMRITFDQPGTYTVLCLEFCGMSHHRMRGVVEVR